jgi:hypothetical protein
MDQRVKCWNQLVATPAPFQVEWIRIIESNVFASQTIPLDRVAAFIGLHGTGKTLLLRIIEGSFGYTTPVYSPPFLPWSGVHLKTATPRLEGVVEVSLKTPSGNIHRTVDLSQPSELRAQIWKQIFGESFMAWYADPVGAFLELHLMCDSYGYDFTAERAKSEVERKLSKADLGALNNILGRRYDRVSVRNGRIDDDGADMPFISAVSGSKIFDNTAMSQGELWVHYISWLLEYEKDKGHLALIDEPESFLSAQGRRAFIDYVARSALRNDRQVVIGTHSPEILSRFPLKNVRMCIPGDSGIQIVIPRSLVQIHDCIGIQTPIRSLALVEDELAKQLLVAIFAQYDTALTREIEVVPTGGAAEVLTGHRILKNTDRLICFAVLDGDQRKRQPGEKSESSLDVPYFLPGNDLPEVQLISAALEQLNWCAEVLGVYEDQIFAAVNSCQHLDHQYRLARIAEQLGCHEDALTQIFIRAWLRQGDIAREAERLAQHIRNSISRLSP